MSDCTGRHDEPEPAWGHSYLCRPCRSGLHRDARRVTRLYVGLEHLLDTRHPWAKGDGTGLPYNDPAAECRSQIMHDLRYWAAQITTDRKAEPPRTEDLPPALAVAVLATTVTRALRWVPYRDWAGHLAAALLEDCRRAVAIRDPWPRKHIPFRGVYRRCLDEACDGSLSVTIYPADGDRRRPYASCDSCGKRWEPEQWHRFSTELLRRTA